MTRTARRGLLALGALALGTALLAGCAAPPPSTIPGYCRDYRYESQFSYPVHPTAITGSGIQVDPGRQDVSLERIDELTDQVEHCLEETFGNPPRLPPAVVRAADCVEDTFALPLQRECFVVKVPDDWQLSCDGTQQVLPAHAPDALCRLKGLEPTAECPCRWRAGIEDGHVLVVTPDAHLFKDPLVRLATGCNNPWAHPLLARCAKP